MMKYQENSSSNIMNMPAILFAAFAVVILIAMYTNRLPNNMFGGLAVCLVFGYVLKFIIEHIPILHKTIGLAAVSFICAFLVYKNWIPESTVEIVSNTINGKTDILSFYVGALLCGSIIGMDRNMLIKAGTRYFVPILGGILFAYVRAGRN